MPHKKNCQPTTNFRSQRVRKKGRTVLIDMPYLSKTASSLQQIGSSKSQRNQQAPKSLVCLESTGNEFNVAVRLFVSFVDQVETEPAEPVSNPHQKYVLNERALNISSGLAPSKKEN